MQLAERHAWDVCAFCCSSKLEEAACKAIGDIEIDAIGGHIITEAVLDTDTSNMQSSTSLNAPLIVALPLLPPSLPALS